jgi:hypothetical protein
MYAFQIGNLGWVHFLKWAWLRAPSKSAHLASPKVTKALAAVASSSVRSQPSDHVAKLGESMIFLTNPAIALISRLRRGERAG